MDPYVYPETNVLRNLLEIRDRERLARVEMDASSQRLLELEHDPIPGRLDSAHLRAIHGYIFQDVYEWAGEFRTVNICRSDQYSRLPSSHQPDNAPSHCFLSIFILS